MTGCWMMCVFSYNSPVERENNHNLATEINRLCVRIVTDKQNTIASVQFWNCHIIEILNINIQHK